MAQQTLTCQLLLLTFLLSATLIRAHSDGSVAGRPRRELEALSPFLCPSYIYAFGDSYTDTGNLQAINPAAVLKYPYGESYCFPDRPKERTRYCDGRLIIDFISKDV